MDEREYEVRAAEAFTRVADLFEEVDPDVADLEQSGDVIRIDFPSKTRVVLNTQRPARQIWLAGGQKAWHFDFASDSRTWIDAKNGGVELFATLAKLARDYAELELDL